MDCLPYFLVYVSGVFLQHSPIINAFLGHCIVRSMGGGEGVGGLNSTISTVSNVFPVLLRHNRGTLCKKIIRDHCTLYSTHEFIYGIIGITYKSIYLRINRKKQYKSIYLRHNREHCTIIGNTVEIFFSFALIGNTLQKKISTHLSENCTKVCIFE